MLGNANLLPPVVHVKRETLYVVSLAMTGLMRDLGRDFHIARSLVVGRWSLAKLDNFRVPICDYRLEKLLCPRLNQQSKISNQQFPQSKSGNWESKVRPPSAWACVTSEVCAKKRPKHSYANVPRLHSLRSTI